MKRAYLRYTEDVSKNKPGGLKGRKTKPKVVLHHTNEHNPEHCFVALFKLYTKLCPSDRPKDAFYLQPLKKPSPECWFSPKAIGYNKLDATVARLCKDAGISGYQTNHSLRATTATRLYQAGVNEQLVMERMGHQSLDGVRSYKRTSTVQQESISNILNGAEHLSTAPDLPLVPRANSIDDTSGCVVQVNNSIAHSSTSLTMLLNHPRLLTFTLAPLPLTMSINRCSELCKTVSSLQCMAISCSMTCNTTLYVLFKT